MDTALWCESPGEAATIKRSFSAECFVKTRREGIDREQQRQQQRYVRQTVHGPRRGSTRRQRLPRREDEGLSPTPPSLPLPLYPSSPYPHTSPTHLRTAWQTTASAYPLAPQLIRLRSSLRLRLRPLLTRPDGLEEYGTPLAFPFFPSYLLNALLLIVPACVCVCVRTDKRRAQSKAWDSSSPLDVVHDMGFGFLARGRCSCLRSRC